MPPGQIGYTGGSGYDLAPSLGSLPMQTPQATLSLASDCLQAGELEQAIQLCDQILEVEPGHAPAWHLRGIAQARQDDLPEAIASFQQAVAQCDTSAIYHYNLALAYQTAEQFDQAEAAYRSAILRRPDFIEAQTNLGNCLMEQDKRDEAVEYFQGLVETAPEDSGFVFNLANALYDIGDLMMAIKHYRRAIEIEPDLTAARENLGRTLLDVARVDDAAEVWAQWLEHEPHNAVARHLVWATSPGSIPERCDDDYIRQTFDADFARNYDRQLERIDNRGPALIEQAVQKLNLNRHDLRILDAGCGTGLCADAMGPLASSLIGVDLSAEMIAEAAKRKRYDRLLIRELTGFLEDWNDGFDLVVSGDTLCYFGKLEPVLAGIARCLLPGGHLVFTVEALESEVEDTPFDLQPSGRYRHSESYLQQCLERAGLTVLEIARESFRKERGYAVPGLLVTAVRPPSR